MLVVMFQKAYLDLWLRRIHQFHLILTVALHMAQLGTNCRAMKFECIESE